MIFNLHSVLRESARLVPDKPALVGDGYRIGYGELDEAADRLAAGLRAAGIGPGDAVALMLPNIPQFVVAYFAALRLGAVVVPLNVTLKSGEVAHVLGDSGASLVVAWAPLVPEVLGNDIPVYAVPVPGDDEVPPGALPYAALATGGPGVPEIAATDGGDTAVVVYTSGTTGLPKGAALSRAQLYMAFVPELPKNATGKVLKWELSARVADGRLVPVQ